MKTVVTNSRSKRLRKKRIFFYNLFTILQTIGIFCGLIRYYFAVRDEADWNVFQHFGLAACIPSFFLWFLARLQLADSFAFAAVASDQLVSTGLYSTFSHPIYIFSAIAAFSYILVLNKPRLLILIVILLPVQYFRARSEYLVLVTKFGEEYVNLQNQVLI